MFHIFIAIFQWLVTLIFLTPSNSPRFLLSFVPSPLPGFVIPSSLPDFMSLVAAMGLSVVSPTVIFLNSSSVPLFVCCEYKKRIIFTVLGILSRNLLIPAHSLSPSLSLSLPLSVPDYLSFFHISSCRPVLLSDYLSIYHPCIHPSIHPSIHPFNHLSF